MDQIKHSFPAARLQRHSARPHDQIEENCNWYSTGEPQIEALESALNVPASTWTEDVRAIFGGSVELSVHVDLSREVADAIALIKKERDDISARLIEIEARFSALEKKLPDNSAKNATEAIKDRFLALIAEWKATRGHTSRTDKLVLNKAYQAIIGLGQPAIPLLLRELEQRPSHWDWALRAITQTDPVPKEAWGDLKKIASAWISWGKENGFEW